MSSQDKNTPYLSYDLSVKFQAIVAVNNNPKKCNPKVRNKKNKEKNEHDILYIDNQIKTSFSNEKLMIPEYKKRIISMLKTLMDNKSPYGIEDYVLKDLKELNLLYNNNKSDQKSNDINDHIDINLSYRDYLNLYDQLKKLINRVRNIEKDALLNHYTYLTTDIIKEYKKILSTPIKRSFLTKSKTGNDTDNKKELLLDKFLNIASNFIDIDYKPNETNIEQTSCPICNNNELDITDGLATCENCGAEISIISVQTSFKDIDRINLHQRYKYEKISHFKEGVCQYQGKQNKTIDDYFYQKADEWLSIHGLINENAKSKKEKYANVKKEHLRLFISESDEKRITNHYEDLHLIYFEMTGKPCADISHLEDRLYQNFEKLVESFLSLDDIDRINFLNTQFVLRKLLLMENYKINKDDFPGLKTKERQKDHEHLFSKLCEISGLNNPPD